MSNASGAGPSIKIGFAIINIINSTKPFAGINPTVKINNAKISFAKLPIKSNSPAKVVSLVKIGNSINKSGANKLRGLND